MNVLVTPAWAAKEVARAMAERLRERGHLTRYVQAAPEGADTVSVDLLARVTDADTWREWLPPLGRMLADKVIERGWDVLSWQPPPAGDYADASQASSKTFGVGVRTVWGYPESTGAQRARFDVLGGHTCPPVHAWEVWL